MSKEEGQLTPTLPVEEAERNLIDAVTQYIETCGEWLPPSLVSAYREWVRAREAELPGSPNPRP